MPPEGLAELCARAEAHLERAEWHARLAEVDYLIETPPRDLQPWEPLLAIFGEREQFSRRYTTVDEISALNFFTLDADNPNSSATVSMSRAATPARSGTRSPLCCGSVSSPS